MIKSIAIIFLGGGLGSVLRYVISKYLNSDYNFGTFTANLIGCFLIGVFIAYYKKNILVDDAFLFLAVGFCGGLTTFSTFAFELLEMIRLQKMKEFLLYSGLSILLGILMAFVGFKLFERVI